MCATRFTLLQQKMAGQVLPQFQEHPDAWQRVPAILQQSSSAQTKVSMMEVASGGLCAHAIIIYYST